MICGGSHLAATGVAPTQTFPVLMGRRLRAGRRFGTLHTVFYSGRPEELRLRPELGESSSFVLVLIPRNMYGIPLPHHFTLALARLRGRRLTLEDLGARAVQSRTPVATAAAGGDAPLPPAGGASPRPDARVRTRRAMRWLGGFLLTAGCLPALPFLRARYARQLNRLLGQARSFGCRAVVLTTPIPLPGAEYPGASWYQAALARELRRSRGRDVAVADAYRRLRRLPRRGWTLPGDALHLSVQGHRELADELVDALNRVAERQ